MKENPAKKIISEELRIVSTNTFIITREWLERLVELGQKCQTECQTERRVEWINHLLGYISSAEFWLKK